MDSTIAQQQSFDRLQFPQTGLDMSPQQVSPLSYYDPQADFSADSAPSRGSPISPVFGNAFQLPIDSDWPAYLDKSGMSPDLDVYYGESFGGPLAFVDSQNPTLSPTANPLDLMSESVAFGGDLNDVQPLFQSAPAPTTLPIANPPAAAASRMARMTPSRSQSQSSTTPTAPAAQVQTRSQQRAAQRAPARRPAADLKRKSSTCDDSASSRSTSPEPPARRTKHAAAAADPSKNPHNLIEKRYRVNINEKILALRDAVPALRCAMQLQQPGAEAAENDDDAVAEELGGLMPARKLNKATILSKATEYISHLEKKNERLARENEELEKRLAEAQRWQRTQAEAAGYWA
ncbi:Sterol regulatory element-binding protein 1 like [Verticillium longisporum]|uniref:Sterol regulatory element-binding protein 1 like n=1 Tax=Verticillium longisporum TaxID=100787 RepID=A0A0G4KRB6_VERLO|nr:Sterol regulatory element-binding protein 1 like [Verticillium longisporum]KAG7121272.1 Sterol regulatory element-binding protein 1 like [Verticillium longisporum]CRK12294.1 hypothetical protein BN1723_009670 [Verticillium longisporum]CRK26375.1 hypothetical protein BN1708_014511 [Verticillium longisporum]